MSDNELLLAISDIVSKNSKALERRIDRVEDSLTKRIDEVEASLNNKIDEVDRRLSNQIAEVDRRLSTDVHNILLRMENIIEPRLDNIESCYTSTYDRYKDGAEKIETLEMNVSVIQSVVKEYGERLNVLTA